jgi:hypothetical protein
MRLLPLTACSHTRDHTVEDPAKWAGFLSVPDPQEVCTNEYVLEVDMFRGNLLYNNG